jgi:hypothetical protein
MSLLAATYLYEGLKSGNKAQCTVIVQDKSAFEGLLKQWESKSPNSRYTGLSVNKATPEQLALAEEKEYFQDGDFFRSRIISEIPA